MPRLLELFSGTGSLCKPFAEAGWEIVSLDLCGRHGPTIVCDIRSWDYSEEAPFDVLWAGCPCTEYSVAKTRGRRDLAHADALVRRTWQIISHFLLLNQSMLWWVENPDSSALFRREVGKVFTSTVRLDYCQYGAPYRKRTRLATNAKYTPRDLCIPATCPACIDGKHMKTAQQGKQSAPSQRRDGDTNTLETLHAYPRPLVDEIFQVCSRHIWHMV